MSVGTIYPDMAKILPAKHADAIITGLRLLQTSLKDGLVIPNDGDIGDILTNCGDHEGPTIDEIDALLANSFGVF